MDTATRKKEVREQLLAKRKRQSRAVCLSKGRKIAQRVLASLAFQSAKGIHIYLATETEVQTDAIIKEALYRGKRVVVPVISQKRLSLSEIHDLDPVHFQVGPFGIREPIPALQREVKKEEVDLFILPGVAYDRMGRRIGHGGGYYDQFLAKRSCTLIGLAFEFQVLNDLPVDPTDRRVDQIMTERRTIICKKEEGE